MVLCTVHQLLDHGLNPRSRMFSQPVGPPLQTYVLTLRRGRQDRISSSIGFLFACVVFVMFFLQSYWLLQSL